MASRMHKGMKLSLQVAVRKMIAKLHLQLGGRPWPLVMHVRIEQG